MVYCNQCGIENQDDSRFCRKCGSALAAITGVTTAPDRTGPPEIRRPYPQWKFSLWVIVSVLGFLLFALWQSPKSIDNSKVRTHEETARGATAPPTTATESTRKPKTDAEEARIRLAALLQEILRREGRLLAVSTTGGQSQILAVSSDLFREGGDTLRAARRETIDCSDCMLLIRKLGFTQVTFTGINYNARYELQPAQ